MVKALCLGPSFQEPQFERSWVRIPTLSNLVALFTANWHFCRFAVMRAGGPESFGSGGMEANVACCIYCACYCLLFWIYSLMTLFRFLLCWLKHFCNAFSCWGFLPSTVFSSNIPEAEKPSNVRWHGILVRPRNAVQQRQAVLGAVQRDFLPRPCGFQYALADRTHMVSLQSRLVRTLPATSPGQVDGTPNCPACSARGLKPQASPTWAPRSSTR